MFFFQYSKNIKIVLILSIIIRCILEIIHPSFFGDTFIQAQTVYNLIEGNGFTVTNVDSNNDLSKLKYSNLQHWPIGFTIIITPLYYITSNIFYSVISLNLLAICIFFIVWQKILLFLKPYVNNFQICLILFFWSIVIMPFRYMSTTDLWSLTLISTFILQGIIIFKIKDFSIIRALFVALLVFIAAFLRYAYWVYIPILPIAMLSLAYLFNKKLLKGAIIFSSFTAFFFIIFAYFQISYFGSLLPSFLSTTIYNDGINIYWENILKTNPIFFNIFFRGSIFERFLEYLNVDYIYYIIFHILTHIFSLIILIPILVFIIKKFKSIKFQLVEYKKSIEKIVFIFLGLILVIFNFLFLLYGSLKNTAAAHNLFPHGYTQLADVRYFSLTVIILFVFIVIAYNKLHKSLLIRRLTKIVFLLSFSFSIIFNVAFLLKRFDFQIPFMLKYQQYDKIHFTYYKRLLELKKNENIVILVLKEEMHGEKFKYTIMGRLANYPFAPVDNYDFDKLHTSENTKVLCILNKKSDKKILNELSKYYSFDATRLLKSSDDYLITFDVKPQ